MLRRATFFAFMGLIWSVSLPLYAELVAHWPLNDVDSDVFVDRVAGNNGFLPEGVTVEFADDGPPGIFDTSVVFTGFDNPPSYIETPFVGIGGALIGAGGILLSFLKMGKPLLSKNTIHSVLPGLLLIMMICFIVGFAALI